MREPGKASGSEKRFYTVEETWRDYLEGMFGSNFIRAEIKAGRLASIRCGRRILLTKSAIESWLQELTKAG